MYKYITKNIYNTTSDKPIKKIFLMCVYHVEMKWFEKTAMTVTYWYKENKTNINLCQNTFLMDSVVCMASQDSYFNESSP